MTYNVTVETRQGFRTTETVFTADEAGARRAVLALYGADARVLAVAEGSVADLLARL